MGSLTVVIPFYRGWGTLGRLLDSLPSDLPVIVVDDGWSERDDEPEVRSPRHRVIHCRERRYFAGAVNTGISQADGDVLVVNQDAWFEGDGWLDMLAEKSFTHAMIGERVRGENETFPNGYIHGTFMYLRRDALDEVGPFNEGLYPLWGCTAEWQLRAARSGFQILPLAQVPDFQHGREETEQFGSSIKSFLQSLPRDRMWKYLRTPPLISVVVPCYNYGRYLEDCVNSLIGGPTSLGPMLGQSVQSFEIIIVDDKSKDDSLDHARRLVDPWQGIWLIEREENGGTAAAVNTGVRQANGEYVTFLSADDMRRAGSLERLVKSCQENPHTVACDNADLFCNGEIFQRWTLPPYDFDSLLYKNHVHAGILYPKAAWEEVGGYPEIMRDGREDWAFNVALGLAGWCVVNVPEHGYLYRREKQNRSLRNTSPYHHEQFLNRIRNLFPRVYEGVRPMSCCGKGRARARPAPVRVARGGSQSVSSNVLAGADGMIRLEYLGSQMEATWTGSVSHKRYRFGANRRIGWVDSRDVGGRNRGGFLNLKNGSAWTFALVEEKKESVKNADRNGENLPEVATQGDDTKSGSAYLEESSAQNEGGSSEAAGREMPHTREFPDPGTLTVDEIKDLDLTPAGWYLCLQLEKEGKNRITAVEHMESMIDGS